MMNIKPTKRSAVIAFKAIFCLALSLLHIQVTLAQSPWIALGKKPSTLGLAKGFSQFDAGPFKLKLVKASQTVAGLQPKMVEGFDFVPSDSLKVRSSDGLYHLGDINLKLRSTGNETWTSYSTAAKRAEVKSIAAGKNVLSAADLAATLPADIPLQIIRSWEMQQGKLVLRFELKNKSSKTVEIGALGIPMIFDNILEGRTLEQTHAKMCFTILTSVRMQAIYR